MHNWNARGSESPSSPGHVLFSLSGCPFKQARRMAREAQSAKDEAEALIKRAQARESSLQGQAEQITKDQQASDRRVVSCFFVRMQSRSFTLQLPRDILDSNEGIQMLPMPQ